MVCRVLGHVASGAAGNFAWRCLEKPVNKNRLSAYVAVSVQECEDDRSLSFVSRFKSFDRDF
jgi:hypothetical protein